MDDPIFFMFAEELVRCFQIAFATFLACVAVGLLIAVFRKPSGSEDS